jgi:hypothetical protein
MQWKKYRPNIKLDGAGVFAPERSSRKRTFQPDLSLHIATQFHAPSMGAHLQMWDCRHQGIGRCGSTVRVETIQFGDENDHVLE